MMPVLITSNDRVLHGSFRRYAISMHAGRAQRPIATVRKPLVMR